VQQRCEAGKGRLYERRWDGGDRKKREKKKKRKKEKWEECAPGGAVVRAREVKFEIDPVASCSQIAGAGCGIERQNCQQQNCIIQLLLCLG
jgi:hypothetical protein